MNKSWRPKDWINHYSDDRVEDFDLSRFVAIMKDGSCIDETWRKALRDRFEAGADAILSYLLGCGIDIIPQLEALNKNGKSRDSKRNIK